MKRRFIGSPDNQQVGQDLVRVATFNANGIRAAVRRGFGDWLATRGCDLVAVQEMRCGTGDLPDLPGYHLAYDPGSRPGRNGVAVYSRMPPGATRLMDRRAFADEGRYLEVDYDLGGGRLLTVVSVYVPKGGWASTVGPDAAGEARRLAHKQRFCASLTHRLATARRTAQAAGRELLVMGDLNIAHTPQDLARASANRRQVGFLPWEREWLGAQLSPRRLVDVVRRVHPDAQGPYSWWRWGAVGRPGPFEGDVGWRIDYHLATPGLARRAVAASTDKGEHAAYRMSDHAPVVVDYDWPAGT